MSRLLLLRCVLFFVAALCPSASLFAQRSLALTVTGNQFPSAGAARVMLTSVGNENRVTFTVAFDPTVLRFDTGAGGTDLGSGGTVSLNPTQIALGRIGVDVALPAGATFAPGVRQLAVLNFSVLATTNTNTALYFTDAPTDAFVYTVGPNTSTTSFAGATVSVVVVTAAPVILTEPAGLTVTSGTRATLTVAASGAAPLTYQWRRNGFPLAGATASTYDIVTASRADADLYDVVVTNASGSATSVKARLSVAPTSYPGLVAPDPAWALQPENDSGSVSVLLPLADGRCYMSGAFLRAGGARRANVLRLLADGSVDPAFVPAETDNTVTVLAVQPDGKLLLAGFFSRVGGVLRNRLVRLNADGSEDAAFNFGGSGLANTVNAMAVQADGKIVIAGTFSAYNGASCPPLIRLHPDGSRDLTFGLSLSGVTALAATTGGKLLVGGSFTYNAGGTVFSRLLRLNADGSVDPMLTLGAGFGGGNVNVLRLLADGRMVAGGTFTSFNGTAAVSVVRLLADGLIDPTFVSATTPGGTINSLALLPNGKTLVGGVTAAAAGFVSRLDAGGAVDATFTAAALPTAINAVAAQNDGRLLVGGAFTTAGGVTRYGLARLNADGALDAAYNLAMHGSASIGAMAALPGGKFLIARSFDYMRGVAVSSGLVRCNADGTLDATFNPGGTGADAIINALVRQPDGKILITGNFTTYNGTAVGRIARLNADGTLDATFNVGGTGLDLAGTALGLQSGGRIVVAGTFTAVNGVTRSAPVARLNPDGTLDTTFVPPAITGGAVETLLVQPDGRILLGGTFTSVNGSGFGRLVRLNPDGVLDTSFGPSPAPGPSGPVYALALEPSGTILIGGTFTQYVTTSRPYLARLGADGALFADFNPVLASGGGVFSLLSQEDGKVIARGSFTSAGGGVAGTAFLARFKADGSHDATFAAGGIASSGITRTNLLMRDDGQLFVPAGTSVGLQVTQTAAAPTISTAPANQSVVSGGTASFSVAISSKAPSTCQWLFNDIALPGANSLTLTLPNVTAAAAGSYRAVIASELGTVTSSAATLTVSAQSGPLISTFAGTVGVSGTVDGTGTAAQFAYPNAIALDASGNSYVTDAVAHVVRKITSSGVVTTFAGTATVAGGVDGLGASARFNGPSGVAVDASGHVYVADTNNHTIRRILPSGTVVTVAGSAGVAGAVDGLGSTARFNYPFGVAVDRFGTLYVADTYSHTIRRIALDGTVSTMAGAAGTGGATDGAGTAARFRFPTGIAVDTDGFVYVADSMNGTIRKLAQSNFVTTYAGTAGSFGSADGAALTVARFNQPNGIAVDGAGVLYVADTVNHNLRRISVAGEVSTVAGLAGTFGSTDGSGSAVRFFQPTGVALDATGNLFIADTLNRTIRRSGSPALPPVVTAPAHAAVMPGSTAQFSVVATGTPATFAYQWYRAAAGSSSFLPLADAGGIYSGATAAQLTVANVTLGMSGDQFHVVVSNGIGTSVTSAPATLTVLLAPVFTSLNNATFAVNTGGNFTFQAAGSPAPTFSLSGGTLPPWATLHSATGLLAGTPTTAAGSPFTFTVQAANGVSPAATQSFTLSVSATAGPPVIASISAPRQLVTLGQSLTLGATATSGTTPGYQWKRNGVPLAGATTANYPFANAVPGRDRGWYQLVVTNSAGATTSAPIFVNVVVNPAQVSAWGDASTGALSVPAGLTAVSAVAGGNGVSYALRADGTVAAWGSALRPPAGLADVVALSACSNQGLALKADGTVATWGSVGNTAATVPAGLTGVVSVACGGNHSVALKADGTVVAWGENDLGQTVVPAGLTGVIAVSASYSHSLALKADGTVVAWGGNADGQSTVPAGLTGIVEISAGQTHSLARRSDGTVVAWGGGAGGATSVPAGLTGVVALTAGSYVSYALKADGTFVEWGGGITVPAIGNVFALAAGASHAIALRDATVNLPPVFSGAATAVFDVNFGASFIVAATGSPAPTFSLVGGTFPPWAAFDGSTGIIAGVPPNATGSPFTFTVLASNGINPAATRSYTLTVREPPVIVTQPTAQTAAVGQPVTFSVVASGSPAPTFQWRRNTVPLSGATGATFAIAAVSPADAGSYDVIVSNAAGAVASLPAVLTVSSAPGLVNFSTRLTVPAQGTNATFTIAGAVSKSVLLRAVGPGLAVFGVGGTLADPQLTLVNATTGATVGTNDDWVGGPPMTIALMQAGAFPLSNGSKDSALLLTLAPGTYTARLTGAAGSTGVALFELYDVDSLRVSVFSYLSARHTLTAEEGTFTAGFTVAGTRPLLVRALGPSLGGPAALPDPTLQVFKDATPIAANNDWGGDTALAALAAQMGGVPFASSTSKDSAVFLASAAGGSYFAQVLRGGGASGTVLVELFDTAAGGVTAPFFMAPLASLDAVASSAVTFTAPLAGGGALAFQWRRNGVPLSGATGATYTIAAVQASDAGNYDVIVTNSAGTTTSSVAVLAVAVPVPPTLTSQPVGGVLNLGNVAAFSVTATGGAPLTYQWRRNGQPISGASGSVYSIGNAQLSHAGDYTVVVSNGGGTVTSAVATLAFSPLVISRHPLPANAAPGTAVSFAVTATGASALAYQWRKDGVPVPGATLNNYPLPSAQLTDAGTYDVLVSNVQGTLTSAPAALTFVGRSVTFTARLAIGSDGAHAFFTVEGAVPRQLLLRAVGPGLTPLGVTGVMPDPQLEVYDAAGVAVAFNDRWSAAANATTIANSAVVIGAFTLATGSQDAAMLRTFAPGTYTVRVGGADRVGGIALLELYDVDPAPATSALPYVAVRGRMAPGGEVLIGGLAATERGQRSFLLRAVGPALGEPGALANPSFTVIRESTLVGSNDDWDALPADGTLVTAATTRVAAFPLPAGSRDAALVLTGNVHAGSHTVQLGGPAGASGTVLLELHDLAATRPATFAPVIVSPPLAQSVTVGGAFALRVLAHGTAPLLFQWRKNGLALPGEIAATLTRPAAELSDGGVYTVTVANGLGAATSLPAIVTLTAAGGFNGGTQASATGGYVPGGTVTLTNTLTYTGAATAIGWSVELPPGWSYVSQAGSVAQVAPAVGLTGNLEWAWTSPPLSPFSFSYTLAAPAGESGVQTMVARAIVRTAESPIPLTLAVSPNPLTLVPASPFHSADTDRDSRLGLIELTRVIELYNTRIGTTRTGRYRPQDGTEDGFGGDATTVGTAAVVLARYHHADTNRDGRLSLVELTRVIELYNTRSGTSRTGAYHLQGGTEDGFAPGP